VATREPLLISFQSHQLRELRERQQFELDDLGLQDTTR